MFKSKLMSYLLVFGIAAGPFNMNARGSTLSSGEIVDIVSPLAAIIGIGIVGFALYQRISYNVAQYKAGNPDPVIEAFVDAVDSDNLYEPFITSLTRNDVSTVKNILKANPATQEALKGEIYSSAENVCSINTGSSAFRGLVEGNMPLDPLASPVDLWVASFNQVATKIADCIVASQKPGNIPVTGDDIIHSAKFSLESGQPATPSEFLDNIDTMTAKFNADAIPSGPPNEGPVVGPESGGDTPVDNGGVPSNSGAGASELSVAEIQKLDLSNSTDLTTLKAQYATNKGAVQEGMQAQYEAIEAKIESTASDDVAGQAEIDTLKANYTEAVEQIGAEGVVDIPKFAP